ncbi:MAG: radical SAM/SPASM domain-containing protein, partial [bacterium]
MCRKYFIPFGARRFNESAGNMPYGLKMMQENAGIKIAVPERIRLEASSVCQLRCPSCRRTGKGTLGQPVGNGTLKLADFKKLLDDNPEIREIELANQGEVFLNPDLPDILRYACKKHVALTANTGVNLNSSNEELLEALVKYQFRSIVVSIDGASAGTYSIFRVNGNFDRVLENIRKINAFKERHQSVYPALTWKFIVFRHNEHDEVKARELAQDLKMSFQSTMNFDERYDTVHDLERFRRKPGAAVSDLAEHRRKYKTRLLQDYCCYQLWNQPQINWDGKVLGCCNNLRGEFGGNAFRDGLQNSLNTEKIQYARRMLLGASPPRDDLPCTRCAIYQEMLWDDSYLSGNRIQWRGRMKEAMELWGNSYIGS